MDDRGLVHAGTGENLARARAPGYLDTGKGRVALIAMASSMTQGSQAGEQRPDMVGRPGLNPLRFKTEYTVDAKIFDTLRSVAKLIMHDGSNEIVDDPELSKNKDNQPQLIIQGVTFVRGEASAIHSFPDSNDLKNLVASVLNARREAEWVIVSSHTHERGAEGDDTPPEFLITAAHAAIDAGADIFVAHGPHILRGIEIYHGRPIFYSLGDFIFENETMQFQPAEIYDALGLPSTANVADIYDTRSLLDTRGFPARKAVWESVVAKVSFHKDHSLAEVNLIPISLGFKESRYERGRPKLASPEQSKSIIEGVSKLSEAFGTKIVFGDNRGTVVVDPPQSK
jgi:poly-gamma-glutamate synthesis protein (capsule biosynthesis protein)